MPAFGLRQEHPGDGLSAAQTEQHGPLAVLHDAHRPAHTAVMLKAILHACAGMAVLTLGLLAALMEPTFVGALTVIFGLGITLVWFLRR